MRQTEKKHKGRIARLIRSLRHDQSGVALIEAGFVLPVLCMLIIGTMEVGAVMLSKTILEGAIADASRQGITGYTDDDLTREEYINKVLQERTFGFISASNLEITQKVYDSFSDIETAEPYTDVDEDGSYTAGVDSFTDMNCNNQWDSDLGEDGVGGPGDIVTYTVTYDADFMTGYFSHLIGDKDGKIRLEASTAVKNEPYGSASADCTPEVKT